MLCLNCKNEIFAERVRAVTQTFRGQTFVVNAPSMECTNCAWVTMTDDQASALCVLTADEYRRRNGLLTSAEIIAFRSNRDMSQAQFAEFLGVGIASVKRWETGSVQDSIYDGKIRAKCADTPHFHSINLDTQEIRFVRLERLAWPEISVRSDSAEPSRAAICATMEFDIKLSDGTQWREDHNASNADFAVAA